jgi:hypothetical protein
VSHDETIVLPFGTKVRMTSLDRHGLLGRDLHPMPSDMGFTGVIVSNLVDLSGVEPPRDEIVDVDVAPGTAIPEDAVIIYTVRAPDGRKLELASYEVEVVS